MNEVPLGILVAALALLLVLSGFFSGSETGLMSLNRYRLRHLAQSGDQGARRAARLLERPDRLIGLILLGNNFVNILASAIATVIAIRLLGDAGVAAATVVMTLLVLIFAEVTPKTLAALHPERIAFPASWVLAPLLRLLYPFVWLVNLLASVLLRPLGVRPQSDQDTDLSPEELRTVVREAGALIPKRHRNMLLSILELEDVRVEDIMVPRSEIAGVDLDDPWEEIIARIKRTEFTKLLVYRAEINNVVGVLHTRRLVNLATQDSGLTREELEALIREPYYIPEGTPLNTQLINFQKLRRRWGLVVDEYGDVMGLVTLEDILEEIVGEFTTGPSERDREIRPQPDGSFLVEGSASLRALHRALGWEVSADGPRTLNGLIVEHLETIPDPGTQLTLHEHPVEILEASGNRVKLVRVDPAKPTPKPED